MAGAAQQHGTEGMEVSSQRWPHLRITQTITAYALRSHRGNDCWLLLPRPLFQAHPCRICSEGSRAAYSCGGSSIQDSDLLPWMLCGPPVMALTGYQRDVSKQTSSGNGAEDAARSEGTPSCQARRQRTEDEAGSGNDANDDTLHGSTRQMPDGSSARTAAGLPHKVFAELQTRQLEVEMLLRLQLSSEEDIAAALRRVSQALRFEEELDELATSRDVLKGRLFQAMLESQRVRRAADVVVAEAATEPLEGPRAPPSKGDGSEPSVESQQPPLIGNADFGLTSVEWAELVEKANDLCELIKIKVQDDNDLKTARAGLDVQGFLDTLIRSADRHASGFTAFDVHLLLLRDG